MEIFDLDKQISKIGLRAVGITDNGTIEGGLIGWLNDGGILGSKAVTNTYVEGIIPDLYILFYSVAAFIIIVGILTFYALLLSSSSAYALVALAGVLKRVFLATILVISAIWIIGWFVELSDGLTAMFGLNEEIMTFVVQMFTSSYCCVFIWLGVVGIYQTACLYVFRALILGCLELAFIISIIFWVFGAIELNICKSIENMGEFLIRLMLWGLFVTPMMALCYGVGMGIMMSTTEPSDVMMFLGITVLYLSCLVPIIVFLKFVYNPIPVATKTIRIATRII